MKKILFIIIGCVALCCNKAEEKSPEFENILARISTLEEENKILKDSLNSIEYEFLTSQILIGISDKPILKVGKKNNIVMLLQTYGRKLPKYDIYRIDGNKEIKVGENDGTRFNYEFIPKSIHDNSPKFSIKVVSNGKMITIPAQLRLNVEN